MVVQTVQVRSLKCIITAFACTILAALAARAQDTVDIDLAAVIGPAQQRGSGFLSGFAGNNVADNLLLPIKPRLLRAGKSDIINSYSKCKAMGTAMEITTIWGSGMNGQPGNGGTDWTSWDSFITALTKEMLAKKMADVRYGIWSDADWAGLWKGDIKNYFEAHRRAFKNIRRIHPEAVIVGPNSVWGPYTYWWNDHKDDYTWFMRQFLDYCIANECMPNIIAIHDYSNSGAGIERDAAWVRSYLNSHDIQGVEFEEDDLGPKIEQFRPGTFVSFFAAIERVKVCATAKCCWDNDCNNYQLEGLITPNDRQPRSLWWAYKHYADITGNIVSVKGGKTVDGVAGIESASPPTLRVILGRYAQSTAPVKIHLRNLPGGTSSIAVTGTRIPNSEGNALKSPTATINATYPVQGSDFELTLTDLNSYEAYFLSLALEGASRINPPRSTGMTANPIGMKISSGSCTLRFNKAGTWSFSIVDCHGARVYHGRVLGQRSLVIRALPAGSYICNVSDGVTTEAVTKFVIAR
jgi:xylan 1,4-beta-xylosidase